MLRHSCSASILRNSWPEYSAKLPEMSVGRGLHALLLEKNFLGGHGIVGGQIPVGTGGAFACKYTGTGGVSMTFLGDGASAQGTFHESLNIASLWDLPAIYVIENNQWGMGTACTRAVAVDMIAELTCPRLWH